MTEIRENFIKTKSSWIRSLHFINNDTVLMCVKGGKKYQVSGLPEDVIQNWRYASSFGQYFDRHIRDQASVQVVQ